MRQKARKSFIISRPPQVSQTYSCSGLEPPSARHFLLAYILCQEAPSCSTCGPKFCSMNYSSKVDEYNKQVHGIEKKDYSELVERLVTLKELRFVFTSSEQSGGTSIVTHGR